MEPNFKEVCLAIKPYFDDFAEKFLRDLKDNVFGGDADNFIESKHQVAIIEQMRQTILNETCEGDK